MLPWNYERVQDILEQLNGKDGTIWMMDHEIAYRVLQNACYSRGKYKETTAVIGRMMDHQNKCINIPPVEVARKLDDADAYLPVEEDIFLFLEKAYRDGYYQIRDDRCAFNLGKLYCEERYGHINYPKAAKWFLRGAKAGDGEAEAALGKCHLLGLGVPKNYEKAFHGLVKWALLDTDNTEALYLLGDMYLNGLYVEKDEVQAYVLYRKAWDRDNAQCCIAGAQALLRQADYLLMHMQEKEDCHLALVKYQRAESDFYDYLLSHPLEAQEGLRRAKAGVELARQKLEAEIHKDDVPLMKDE